MGRYLGYVGVAFTEVPPITREFSELAPGVPCFQGIFEKGPVDKTLQILTPTDAIQILGQPVEGYFSTRFLAEYFRNAGGPCFVIRTTHHDMETGLTEAIAASVTLVDGLAVDTLKVEAGRRGDLDPGVHGNSLTVTIENTTERLKLASGAELGSKNLVLKSLGGASQSAYLQVGDEYPEYHKIQSVDAGSRTATLVGTLARARIANENVYLLEFTMDVFARAVRVEHWERLSMGTQATNYVEAVLNHTDTGSIYVLVTDLETETSPPNKRPADVIESALSGGADGLSGLVTADFTGLDAFGKGVHAVEAKASEIGVYVMDDILTLASPEDAVNTAMAYLDELRIVLIHALPWGKSAATAATYVYDDGAFGEDSGAGYWPWLEGDDILTGGKIYLPASGWVAGCINRTAREKGIHKAPAGVEDGHCVGASGVEIEVTKTMEQITFPKRINVIKKIPGYGVTIWGARTFSADPAMKYLSNRLWLYYVQKQISLNILWAFFEANMGAGPTGAGLWGQLTATIDNFMLGEWKKGALVGTKKNEAYFVLCDATINPPDEVNKGYCTVRVGVSMPKVMEMLLFQFVHIENVVTIHTV